MVATDTHIKFAGVEGESTHKDHKGEIEVLSWSWTVSHDVGRSGGGSGKGKAEPGDLQFTHLYDKSSPVLAKHCASGRHFAEVTMTSRKAGEGQKDFLVLKFKEVFINPALRGNDREWWVLEETQGTAGRPDPGQGQRYSLPVAAGMGDVPGQLQETIAGSGAVVHQLP